MTASPIGKLSVGEVGSFRELSAKENPDGLAVVYIPALAALLERAKQLKGSELSEKGLARIAEHATMIAATPEVAKETIEKRGYEESHSFGWARRSRAIRRPSDKWPESRVSGSCTIGQTGPSTPALRRGRAGPLLQTPRAQSPAPPRWPRPCQAR